MYVVYNYMYVPDYKYLKCFMLIFEVIIITLR